MIINNQILALDTMYPSIGEKVVNALYHTKPYSTIYGYVMSGDVKFPNGSVAVEGQYFCFWSLQSESIDTSGEVYIFTRMGYKGQNTIGGPIEKTGRLVYINNCSDSLLVYPPRMGDPSLNLLHFPSGVKQSFHIHPSIRLGVVVDGEGFSNVKENGIEKEVPLRVGDLFCIEERERHRFRTTTSHMTVVPYHPDGDWGPTDHNHTMLNRTYITQKE